MSLIRTCVWTALASAALCATPGLAQDYGVQGQKTAPGNRPNSIDIQPLPLAASAALGGYGAGALAAIGAERATGDKVGVFGQIEGASVRLNQSQTSDALNKNSGPVPRKVDAAGLTLGTRLYGKSATTDSSFLSLGIGANRIMDQWVYGDQTLNEGLWIVSPTVEGGYKWVWNNGFLLRLGVGASAPLYTSRDYNQVSAIRLTGVGLAGISDTETKVRQLEDRQAVAPVVDVAIGWAY